MRIHTLARTMAHRPRLTPLALAVQLSLQLSLHVAFSTCATAAPQGGQVVAGQARIDTQGAQTTIVQSSARAAIDWRSFDLAAHERVRFAQPDVRSVTLNRVLGDQASSIMGRIDANGQVFLINPNGIVFGKGAQVDVSGLVASTANISNTDFMAGRWVFNQPGRPDARVVNQGQITVRDAGVAALVAPHVRNEGTIHARLGRIALAAGEAFTLDLHGDRLIQLVVDPAAMEGLTDAQGRSLRAIVEQVGTLQAEGGLVELSARTGARLLDGIIQAGGHIRATGFDTGPGRITLHGDTRTRLDISGQLDTRGQQGGHIEATAGQVHVQATAVLDASSVSHTGGTIALGGQWRGGGDLAHAQQVFIERGAHVLADGGGTGQGGRISVFSDGDTLVRGSLSARGGELGGDGGAIEVSGLHRAGFDGEARADGRAGGRAGVFLMDPRNLVIGAQGEGLEGMPTEGDYTLDVNALRRVLTTGTSVSLEATQDISVQAMVDGRLPEGGIAGGGLSLTAGRDVNILQSIVLNDGAFKVKAQGHFLQAQGTVISTGQAALSLDAAQGITATQLISRGAVSLSASQGAVQVSQAIVGLDGQGKTTGVSQLSITAGTDVSLAGAWALGPMKLQAGHDITLGGTTLVEGLFNAQATHDLTLSDGGTLDLRQVRQGAERSTLRAGNDLVTGDRTVVRAAHDLLMSAGHRITLVNGQQSAEQAAAYGVQMLGDSVIELHAGSDIDILGSVRAQGGRSGTETVYAHADTGHITVNQLTTTDAAHSRSGSALFEALEGDVVFLSALGGAGTGYDTYEKGYDSSIKPQVGALKVMARRIETNGLNLDGSDALEGGPLQGLEKGYGLWLEAKDALIVNEIIGVNKGDVHVAVTDGMLLLGNSIFSRGWIGEGQGIAYAMDVTAPRIALWDHTREFAKTTFVKDTVWVKGPTSNSGSIDTPNPLPDESVDPNNSGEFSEPIQPEPTPSAPTPPPHPGTEVEDKIFAKITVSNNAANFLNASTTLDTFITDPERKAKVTLSGLLSQVENRGDKAIHLDELPTVGTTKLSVGYGQSIVDGAVRNNTAIGLKVLSLHDAGDNPPDYVDSDSLGSYTLAYADISNLMFEDGGGIRQLFMIERASPSDNATVTYGSKVSGLFIRTEEDGNRIFISDTVLYSQAEETTEDTSGTYNVYTSSSQTLPNNSTVTGFGEVVAGQPSGTVQTPGASLPPLSSLPSEPSPTVPPNTSTEATTSQQASYEPPPLKPALAPVGARTDLDVDLDPTATGADAPEVINVPSRPLKEVFDLGNQGGFAQASGPILPGPGNQIRAPRPRLCSPADTGSPTACGKR